MNFCGLRYDWARICIEGLLLTSLGCSTWNGNSSAASDPVLAAASDQAATADDSKAEDRRQIATALGKAGELRDGVYTVTFPRDDLTVRIEGMDVPTAAGIESTFRFYQCSCGKTVVIGQFVVPDYEANDVAYALQKENILISSMGPFLLYDKPRMMMVRFQGEGTPLSLAGAIKSALDWTGKSRMRGQKIEP